MRLSFFISVIFFFISNNIFAQPPGGPPGGGGSGDPSDLPITVTELNGSNLDFGQIISNSGLHVVDINRSPYHRH